MPDQVPFTAYLPKSTKYCLIIGVLNEGERITKQLAALQPYRALVDIILADGGSTDGATDDAALRDKVSVKLIRQGGGLSSQYIAALSYAHKAGYEGIIFMDGNGKDSVDSLPDFVAKLELGSDFIQGSRFMEGGSHAHTPFFRVWAIKLIARPLFALASHFYYSDPINGYKACSFRFLNHPRLMPLRPVFTGYTLQYYLNCRAPRLGMKVLEIPVSRNYPKEGETPTKIKGLANYVSVLCQMLKVCLGRYNISKKSEGR